MAIASTFDTDEVAPARAKGKGAEPTLCIYFGTDRLARVRERAQQTGESVSAYVSRMCDAAELGDGNLDKLRALARLQGRSVAKVLADMLAAKIGALSTN